MLGTLVMVRAPLTETVDPKVRLPDPPLPLPLPLPLLPLHHSLQGAVGGGVGVVQGQQREGLGGHKDWGVCGLGEVG